MQAADPFAAWKAAQREDWALFAPLESLTMRPAAALVKLAGVGVGEVVLDVGCGTGVVAVTAARGGARTSGLDLSPVLLERARYHAAVAGVAVDFTEGDVEALPYADAVFDVVLSQFAHMFAPRPEMAIREMLRVLKPGGRIAFATWPPELFIGRMFALVASYLPAGMAPAGVAPPPAWGDPSVVRARLGDAVHDLGFDRGELRNPALSPRHVRLGMEASAGPLIKLVSALGGDPARLERFRADLEALIGEYFGDNCVRQHYLLARAIKR